MTKDKASIEIYDKSIGAIKDILKRVSADGLDSEREANYIASFLFDELSNIRADYSKWL